MIYYLLVALFLAGMAAFLHAKTYHARQRLLFHDHHIEAEQGIIARRRYLVRYRNVKRSMITRYPGGEDGELEIFVAAEEEVLSTGQQKQTRQAALKQVSFSAGFIPAVRDTGLLLDDILCGRVEPAPQATAAEPLAVLLESRRSVGNALVKLMLLSVLLFPLIALLPFTIPMVVIRVKRCRYRVEAARIVTSWGIFYRHQMSVLLDRVDSLQQSQGPMNKLFGNGNVSIMTAGSSKPDLHLADSPAYLGMYETIRERSQ
jgi:membrane protein YdbS with pleckstrin-like domain